jgi:hypothetical protein
MDRQYLLVVVRNKGERNQADQGSLYCTRDFLRNPNGRLELSGKAGLQEATATLERSQTMNTMTFGVCIAHYQV